MIEKFLSGIGLSEKEILTYKKLLSVESASVLDIAQKTSINRTTIYPVLESLKEKGLVTELTDGKKTRFHAEPPERLETYIHSQLNKLEEQEKLLHEVVPRLRSISLATGEKPIIKTEEGREGILKSIEEYFQADDNDDTAYLIYPRDRIREIFSNKEINDARGLRLKKTVKSKSIYTTKEEMLPQDEMSERHRIDGDKYPVTADIGIYADRVRIHTLGKNLSATVIKSKDVADTLRTLFKLAILGAKKEESGE